MKKVSKNKPCPYCDEEYNGFTPLNQTVDYSGIEIAINNKGMLRARCYSETTGNLITQDVVNIRYCPVCGRELRLI